MTKIKKEVLQVDSSAIKTLTYNFQHSKLLVLFNSDTVYSYDDVPQEIFYKIKFSESIGKSFNSFILNKYNFERLN